MSTIKNSIKREVSLHHQLPQHRLNTKPDPQTTSQPLLQYMKGVQEHSACPAKMKDTGDQRHSFGWGSNSETSFVWLVKRTQHLENDFVVSQQGCVFGIG